MNRTVSRTLFLLVAVACLLQTAVAQTRITEPSGGFSYTLPKGWSNRTLPGLKYKIALAAISTSFSPNINIVDESAPVGITQYADVSVKTLQKAQSEFKLVGRSDFTTKSGIKGARVVSENTNQGKRIRNIFLMVPGKGDNKFVITFTALASDGTKYDKDVDTLFKSFSVP